MCLAPRAKVLLLIPHLGGGGAEHVVSTLAQYLSRDKYELHLGLVTQSACLDPDVPSAVTVHCLGARRVRHSASKLLRLVWQVRPQIILSGMAHLNLLTLMLRPLFPAHTRVIVRHNGALAATLILGTTSRPSRRLFSAAYRHADSVICQTNFMAHDLHHQLSIDHARLVVLANPVNVQEIRALTPKNIVPHHHRILAIARLAPEKGIDLLLEAFARVLLDIPTASLEIAGEGSCESALRAQCQTLGIEPRVTFLGVVSSPAERFTRASLFVLPSRHEGLPNAVH